MINLSSNLKKIALSLLVVGLAIGTQAFKSTESNITAGDLYGSRPGVNPFEKLSDPYDPTECVGNPNKRCFYSVTTAGAGTVTAASYSEAQLEIWASQSTPYVTRSSTTGIYNGE